MTAELTDTRRSVLAELQDAAARKWQGDPAAQGAGLFARAAAEMEWHGREREVFASEVARLRAAIEEAMPFQMTIGAEILSKALGEEETMKTPKYLMEPPQGWIDPHGLG